MIPHRRMTDSLILVVVLLFFWQALFAIVGAKGESPQFASIGVALGAHNLPVVLARIQRGMLRLLALDAYLYLRVKRGQEIPFVEPRAASAQTGKPLPEAPAAPKSLRKRDLSYNPESAHIPTMEEMEAEVRRAPIGRTIARVGLDLGVVPAFCSEEMGNALLQVLEYYGGSLARLFAIRRKREIAFQEECDRRPDTWEWNWRDLRKDRRRQVLGYLIGEERPDDPVPFPA